VTQGVKVWESTRLVDANLTSLLGGAANWRYGPALLGCHAAAFLGAMAASLRAGLAVVVLVLRAFVAAGLAYLRAQLAQLLNEVTATRHAGCRESTDGSAVHVQRDAPRHHLDVFFPQARGCAVVTGVGARVAGVDTSLVLLVRHLNPLGWREWQAIDARRPGS
jgi:hypothetical protein